jgi:hypothetical protein
MVQYARHDTSWKHSAQSFFGFRQGFLEQATLPVDAYLEVAGLLAGRTSTANSWVKRHGELSGREQRSPNNSLA